jgi:hypothetical protein
MGPLKPSIMEVLTDTPVEPPEGWTLIKAVVPWVGVGFGLEMPPSPHAINSKVEVMAQRRAVRTVIVHSLLVLWRYRGGWWAS